MNTSLPEFQARATLLARRRGTVRAQIAAACDAAARSVQEVTLLAVSKTFPAADVRALHADGQRAFGENYVQEGCAKVRELADLRPDIDWHMIGPLQSNKTREVAEHFDWVHTVDRLKIAERLSAQRPSHLGDLQVLLQVNIDGAPSKAGASPSEALALARAVAALPRLALRGLMVMPDPSERVDEHFAAAHALFVGLQTQLSLECWDQLSMGMSGDLDAAIANGSRLVRVGSAIFGVR